MNNGPEQEPRKELGGDLRENDLRELATVSEIAEPAMEAMLRERLREPLALPAGFKERVLARATTADATELKPGAFGADERRSRPGRVLAFPRAAVWRLVAGGALAASVLAGTFGVEQERRHRAASRMAHEHMRANQEFAQATRITDAALAHTREQLQQAGVFEDEGR